MNGTDPQSARKTNMKGHPDSPPSLNTCKHPSLYPSIFLPQLIPTPKHRRWPKRLRIHPRIPQRSSNSFLGRTDRYTVPSRLRHRCTPLEWYELPEPSYRRRRFGVAMHGIGLMQPPEVLTNGEFLSLEGRAKSSSYGLYSFGVGIAPGGIESG